MTTRCGCCDGALGTTLPCGCCAGAAVLTPASVVNPAGLTALDYRAGTHATFLASMKARLSALFPVLHTRDTEDPSVALLDAAALMADLLTFYTERIANEGYLRTATEGRSVLELGNLVGYRPRPGVSASVYLAFTLEDGYRGIVPSGTRAQSLPAPGELSQPFETDHTLEARAEWNTLKPRTTRPQKLPLLDKPGLGHLLYLAGTRTLLGVNDPLLLWGTLKDPPAVARVRDVRPEPADDRTVTEIEAWLRPTSPVPVPEVSLTDDIRRLVRETLDLEAHHVEPGPAAEPAVASLRRLDSSLADLGASPDPGQLRQRLEAELTELRVQHARARERRWTRIEPWLGGFIAAAEALLERVKATEPPATAVPGTSQPGFGPVAAIVSALAKPVSVPPAAPTSLKRDPQATYAATSDTLPRLLAAVRPDLGAVLYQAWDGHPVIAELKQRLEALHVRARLYGHNAPARRTERFSASFSFPVHGDVTIRLTLADRSLNLRLPPRDHSVTTAFPEADEEVTVTLSGFGSAPPARAVTVSLTKRRVVITWRLPTNQGTEITCVGSDPTAVSFQAAAGSTPTTASVTRPATAEVRGTLYREPALRENPREVSLDASYPQILPGSWVVIEKPQRLLVRQVDSICEVTRADYGVAAPSTRLVLDQEWLDEGDGYEVIRGTTVYAKSEPLTLADTPIRPLDEPICAGEIELDGLYEGLEPGRWLIIEGERTDVPGVQGPRAAELAMLAGVEQVADASLPGDTTHTVLRLANELAYRYRRDTAIVYGNVVGASHGETRTEVLGSGNASVPGQRFTLRQSPLTYTAAATPSGVQNSLQVRVNDILWHEQLTLTDRGPRDHDFMTITGDDQQVMLIFGDGLHGSRLPTGTENVTAVYRTGIGQAGNLPSGRISQLATRPLGVKEVVNPVPSTGGADRDGRDQARRNVPLSVTALDRLVSIRDYEDFARTFAGIGKSSAVTLSDGRRRVIHVTIAGADDAPISPTSDLFARLLAAFRQYGDPHLPVQLAVRELLTPIISGTVSVLPDYRWASVEPRVRSALLDTFGFARRELAQDLWLSEVMAVIQGVEGVAFADIDVFTEVTEATLLGALATSRDLGSVLSLKPRIPVSPARADPGATDPEQRLRPAQLAYLGHDVANTLLLTERTT